MGRRHLPRGLLLVLGVALAVGVHHLLRVEEAGISVNRLVQQAQNSQSLPAGLELPAGFCILFNGAPAPFDETTNTLYLPQSLDATDWQGTLSIGGAQGGYRFALLGSDELQSKADALQTGTGFALQVQKGGRCAQYTLVFTGLPVVTLNEQSSTMQGERLELFGDFTLSEPEGAAEALVCYWRRGGVTSQLDKASWRLSLKDTKEDNYALPLLGMRSDDDWILNALHADPNRIREKLCQELWQRMQGQGAEPPVSQMQYVELVQNGQYMGLYGLQVPLDAKQVGLQHADEALFKISLGYQSFGHGWAWPFTDPVTGMIEQKWLEAEGADAYAANQPVLQAFYELTRGTASMSVNDLEQLADVNNLLDNYCFMQFVYAGDNDVKNHYMALKRNPAGELRLFRALWDMDLTFGLVFQVNAPGFSVFDANTAAYTQVCLDTAKLLKRPEAIALFCQRWSELRGQALDDEWCAQRMQQLAEKLVQTGAAARESSRWPQNPCESDVSGMQSYIRARVVFMDAHMAAEQQRIGSAGTT